jgi:hypothetical protein
MKYNKNYSKIPDSCVFYLINDTSNKRKENRGKIHKITTFDFFIENELTNIKIIENIVNYKSIYYICESNSKLKITEIDEESRFINSGKEIKLDETILLNYEDKKLTNLKMYLTSLNSSTKYVYTIIDFYKRLINSISLLVEKQVVHNHINFNTIVIDENEFPLLTNFSFSINIAHNDIEEYIKHFFIEYDPSYLEWPLEFHILSYMLTNKISSISSFNLENIICNVIDNNNILKTFGDTIVSSYKLEALEYFKKYVNQSYEYILKDILQHYSTWDNYSLSIMFLRILIGIHRSIGIKNKFIILFMKLLVSNIHLNPLKRQTLELTSKNFELLIDSLETKDYKCILNILMSS